MPCIRRMGIQLSETFKVLELSKRLKLFYTPLFQREKRCLVKTLPVRSLSREVRQSQGLNCLIKRR